MALWTLRKPCGFHLKHQLKFKLDEFSSCFNLGIFCTLLDSNLRTFWRIERTHTAQKVVAVWLDLTARYLGRGYPSCLCTGFFIADVLLFK